jgi:hypothetical protein
MERKTPQRDCGPGLYEAFTPMKQRRSGCRLISSWTWSAIDSRNEANDPNIFDESDLGEGVQELQEFRSCRMELFRFVTFGLSRFTPMHFRVRR